VKAGIVTSLIHPGGNVTGFFNFGADYGPKRLEILAELLPAQTTVFGALINPSNPDAPAETAAIENAAKALGRRIVIANANTEAGVDSAFTIFAEQHVGALYVGTGTLYLDYIGRIAAVAERQRIPAIYQLRDKSSPAAS